MPKTIESGMRCTAPLRQPAGPVASSRLIRTTVLTEFGTDESLRKSWDDGVIAHGGNIYMTYDWLRTWWQFYGQGKQLRLFRFFHGDELVGQLPLYLESFGAGPLTTKVARLVGANIPPKAFTPPLMRESAREAFRHVLQRLFADEGCDLFALGPVPQSWPSRAGFEAACAQSVELILPATYHGRDVQTLFKLPASFEAYLKSLSSSERKNRLKRLRHLEKDYTVTSDSISDPVLAEPEFNAFVALHARQWQAVGKSGHFAAWPEGEAYNRAQVRAQARQGRVRFFRMLVDGHVVASRYTFLLGKTLYSELPAREVGEPWDKLGIGAISLLKFNEAAIEAGVAVVDSGLGGYEHKAALGGEQIPVGVWHVTARGFSGLRARFFLGISKLVLFLCHKLWYRRVLPRLPRRFKRTQQSWWLRVDI